MTSTLGLTIRPLDGPAPGVPTELVVDDHGHWRAPGDAPPGEVIDSSRWWALVGLADCHAHLGGSDLDHMNGPAGGGDEELVAAGAWAQLEGGVFLVADKGSKNDLSLRILDAPPTKRPDLHMAGRVITVPGGYYGGFGVETDEAGLVDAVRAAAATVGATWVKLIGDWPRKGVGAVPNFEGEALSAAVRVAHEGGCRVAIHACAPRTSSLAVAAGVDSIEHGLFLTADDLAALGRRGGAWVPTICAMQGVADMLGPTSSGGRLFAEGLDNIRDLLPSASGLGVSVLAGTDLHLAHGAVAAEAVRLVEYGLTPEAALRAVSGEAYDYLGQRGRGFAPGLPADVVFFDTDPRDDIGALTRPVLAIRHGRVVVDRRSGR
jgi:imidazolonepropionase-like amidohydrolase